MSTTFSETDIVLAYFKYNPNHAACYVAIAVFALLSILLTIRIFRSNCPLYLLFLPFISIIETVGFILRYVCSIHPTIDTFIATSILLLIAGNIIILINYKAVGDLILFLNAKPRYFVIGPKFTRIFCQLNIAVTILQSVGGSMQYTNYSIGSTLIIVGTSAQLLLFVFFFLCAHYIRICSDYQYDINEQAHKIKLMRVIRATTVLIFAHSAYRLIKYILALYNITTIEEWEFYVFDALLMVLCFLIYLIWFIGNYIPARMTQQNYLESLDTEETQL